MLVLTGLSSFPREEPSSLWQPRPLAGKGRSDVTQKERIGLGFALAPGQRGTYPIQVQGMAGLPERPVALDQNWWRPAPPFGDSTARQFLTYARV